MVNRSLPKDWIQCPQKSNALIASIFTVFKTPLNEKYDQKLSPNERFHPDDLFRDSNEKPGLWIDLTNTNRYYDKEEIEKHGCGYVKINCDGHGQFPKRDDIELFNSLVQKFMSRWPNGCIAVHCTHGFNRTGFMIISYLVEVLKYNVAFAVESFAMARPPGIYRHNYVKELFKRYGNLIPSPPAPILPLWVNEHHSRRTMCNNSYTNLSSHKYSNWRTRESNVALPSRKQHKNNSSTYRFSSSSSNYDYNWRSRDSVEEPPSAFKCLGPRQSR